MIETDVKSTIIEQDYNDLANHEGPNCDIITSQNKDDPYATDICDKSVGIKSLIKLEDIFIATDNVPHPHESKDIIDEKLYLNSTKEKKIRKLPKNQ